MSHIFPGEEMLRDDWPLAWSVFCFTSTYLITCQALLWHLGCSGCGDSRVECTGPLQWGVASLEQSQAECRIQSEARGDKEGWQMQVPQAQGDNDKHHSQTGR